MFIYSLTPPRTAAAPTSRGAALFDEHCAHCHSNAAYGGGLMPAAAIGTDPALATGRGRGTGNYRVPVLLGIAAGAPYLHDGVVPSLSDLLSAARGVPGHRAGTELSDTDRATLIAYLGTL